ncbi:MAG: FG-GAP repeat domain-containing protein, partial [Pyrinomonadaceae bacterium]
GEWWGRRSTNGSVFAVQFGTTSDRPVQGDYTGDGKADIAFWRPTDGNWFILRSEDSSFLAFPFGSSGDTPVPGDYDGDGRTDSAVFRPSNATWFLNRSTAGVAIQQFGLTSDTPIPSAFVP